MIKLFLHIGFHKTGTTAIQNFLSANRQTLRKRGVLYPDLDPEWINHNPLSWELMDPSFMPADASYYHAYCATGLWNKTFCQIAESGCDTAVLSGEDFSLVEHPEKVAEICSGFETRVIIYIRRQDQVILSLYNQDVKDFAWMATKDLASYFWNHRMAQHIHYDRLIGNWASAFSKEAVSVGVYEERRLPNGLIGDFMERIGVGLDDAFAVEGFPANPSLPPLALELKRILNHEALNKLENDILVDAMCASAIATQRQEGFTKHQDLTPSQQAAFMERYTEGNRRVAMEYLDEDSTLFEDVIIGMKDDETCSINTEQLRLIVPLIRELVGRLYKNSRIWSEQQHWINFLESVVRKHSPEAIPGSGSSKESES